MKAIIQRRYGGPEVLEFGEIETPTPGDGEVLVRVHAASVNMADWLVLTGTPRIARVGFGLLRPKCKVPGRDVAGVVEAVGEGVTRLKPGDEVFGEVDGGAFAEYVCAPEDGVVTKPANLSFEQAAAVPLAGLTALQGLRDRAELQSVERVLVNGASGGVGTFAVQIAAALGAEVTGVCSTDAMEMVRALGAAHVVDYTMESFTEGDRRYDVMLDLVGSQSLSKIRRIMSPTGRYLPSTHHISHLFRAVVARKVGVRKPIMFVGKINAEDLEFLKDLIGVGKVAPVIEKSYPLRETADALARFGQGHARGKTVITV